MKLLITGSTGFVGKNLKEYFSLNCKYKVLAPNEYELDLTNADDVKIFLDDNKVDVVIHSATTLRNGTTYPQDVCEKNLRMFFNLIRSKSDHTKIINLGSGSEYSRAHWQPKMNETFFDKHVPEDPHSYSKYLISKYIENAKELNAVTLRIFGIFGKYEDYRFKFISNAIAKNISRLPITINQNVEYDYVYIDDFCEIIKIFIEKNAPNKSYNITPKYSTNLLEIADQVNLNSDYKSKVMVLNDGLGVTYSGDNSRFIEDFGNFDFKNISNSVSSLYNFYLNIKNEISIQDLESDQYLEYAKNIKMKYFKN